MSGGQDSTTCLFQALKVYGDVYAVAFKYAQRHEVELKYAEKLCRENGVSLEIVDLTELFSKIGNSSLLDGTDINEKNAKGLPTSFVPNRNQIFLTIAHGIAQRLEVNHIITGVCETDYSGYPDCRLEFVQALEHTTNLGSMSKIEIKTPLMHLDKAATFKLAADLGVLSEIVENTITCYNGEEKMNAWGRGCGMCPACKLRERGYNQYLDGSN